MKATRLLTSLAWTSLASAAPLARTAVLIAGSASKTVSLAAVPPNAAPGQHPPHALGFAGPYNPPATVEQHPSASLDSDHPLTTVELMALSANAHTAHLSNAASPEQASGQPEVIKTKVSVGALVAPNSNRQPQRVVQFVEQGSTVKTYLIPVYFVSTQRIDTLLVAAMLTFLMVVVAFEAYNLAVRFGTHVFGEDESAEMQLRKYTNLMMAVEDGESCEPYSDDEDATMAPFGGLELSTRQGGSKLPKLPEKLSEKTSLI